MLLHTTWFGTFLLEDGEVVQSVLFRPDPELLARRMMAVEEREVLPEERQLVRGLEEFFVTERRLESAGGLFTSEAPPFLRPEAFDVDVGLLREAMIALGKIRMERAVSPVDHIVQAVRTYDDLTRTANRLTERLRDWYALHFPELPRLVDTKEFVELVAEHGRREAMPGKAESVGAPMEDEDVRAVQGLAEQTRDLARRRASLDAYIEEKMGRLAPNVAHLAGPIIGARLLALAGGLEEMARMPSSTIQLLGAEKALFRHLKKGSKPPKHGILFQHPWVHNAPYWQRGAIARGLAAKLAIAARADAYTGRFVADDLKAQVETLIEDVKTTHEKPKPRPPRRRGRPRKGRGRRPGRGRRR